MRVLVQPRPGGATFGAIAVAVDLGKSPAVALAPQWVIDWVISHVTGKIFAEQAALARRMRAEPGESAHLRAVAADPAFYQGWLAPRVAAAVAAVESGKRK